jgi:hydroxymethylglutaryl-CoA lyase
MSSSSSRTYRSRDKIKVTAGLACVFGCSFEGWVSPRKVIEIVDAFLALGVDEVSLVDTVAMGDPSACVCGAA